MSAPGGTLGWMLRNGRRALVSVLGGLLVLVGAALLLLPGPGMLTPRGRPRGPRHRVRMGPAGLEASP